MTISNYTDKSYAVGWIDYDDVYQPRDSWLEAFGTFTQRTYATHPFVLIDEGGLIELAGTRMKAPTCVEFRSTELLRTCIMVRSSSDQR
ncbi:MAG: hypothetical protein JSS83_03570 [Cyanobacteria bacterium SZAS LIN-3]|nr:hypothetical protein [Cyanobacteria bacterium SZAS LIN-3]